MRSNIQSELYYLEKFFEAKLCSCTENSLTSTKATYNFISNSKTWVHIDFRQPSHCLLYAVPTMCLVLCAFGRWKLTCHLLWCCIHWLMDPAAQWLRQQKRYTGQWSLHHSCCCYATRCLAAMLCIMVACIFNLLRTLFETHQDVALWLSIFALLCFAEFLSFYLLLFSVIDCLQPVVSCCAFLHKQTKGQKLF